MRAVLVLLLVAGFANSATVDSTKSPKSDWDDDDSMTLASTTTGSNVQLPSTPDIITPAPASAEEQITEEQQRPRFISLIPAGTHDVTTHSQSDQEGHDQIKYRIFPKQQAFTPAATTVNTDSEQDDSSSSSSTTPSSSSEERETSQDSASDEQTTTETSRIKHVQLGKIPLTYEIIPLLPPREEKQQLLGREDTKPISFFPPEEMMPAKNSKNAQGEQEQQQSTTEEDVTTEIITGKPVPDLKELPRVPLTYMVPPRPDVDVPWNPQPTTTTDYPRNLDLPQTTTINPLLERINDFLQKAKRHSLEMETTTRNDNESNELTTTAEEDKNTEKVETTTSAEQKYDNIRSTEAATTTTTSSGERDNQENINTTDPLTPVSDTPEDSNGDLNPSSPAPIPEEPSEEIFTTRGPTILYPRPGYPEVQEQEQDYSPESQPLMPYYPSEYPPSSSPLPPYYPSEEPSSSSPIPPYYPSEEPSSSSPLPPYYPSEEPSRLPPYYPSEYPSSSSPLPSSPAIDANDINIRPSSMDQYYSDYSNINNQGLNVPPQRQLNVNPYYYTNTNPATSFLNRRMMIPPILNNRQASPATLTPPSRPIYISPDSYFPRKYFNTRVGNGGAAGQPNFGGYNTNFYTPGYNTANTNYNPNYNNNPFMSPPSPQIPSSAGGYNNNNNYYGYLRPQRRSPYIFPSTTTTIPLGAALNSILSAPTSSEEPSYSSPPYSSAYNRARADPNEYSSFGNSYYSPIGLGSSNTNSYYSASAYPSAQVNQAQASSPYVINYRQVIPYRSSYPITSSDLVNKLMYAPLYPYEQYRRVQVQQPVYY